MRRPSRGPGRGQLAPSHSFGPLTCVGTRGCQRVAVHSESALADRASGQSCHAGARWLGMPSRASDSVG